MYSAYASPNPSSMAASSDGILRTYPRPEMPPWRGNRPLHDRVMRCQRGESPTDSVTVGGLSTPPEQLVPQRSAYVQHRSSLSDASHHRCFAQNAKMLARCAG